MLVNEQNKKVPEEEVDQLRQIIRRAAIPNWTEGAQRPHVDNTIYKPSRIYL